MRKRRRASWRLGRLGVLEGGQDAAADVGGVVDLLQAGRDALPVVVAEIGVPRAGRQDQVVVGHACDRRARSVRRSVSTPLTLPSSTWTLAARRRMARIGEAICGRRQAGGRDLVEQRLEQMVVAAVDDGDVGGGAGQRLGGAQAAEARADDDDARPGHGGSPGYARPNRLKAIRRSIDSAPAPRLST